MKPTILIVDDDQSIRESLILLLDEFYLPIAVRSGEEALIKLNQTHVDVVLLDVKMHGIDGIETLKRIRDKHEFVFVIMLTVLEDIKVAVTAMKLGANDYLRKPYDKDELLVVLEKNLKIKNGQHEIQYLRSELDRIQKKKEIIGNSPAITQIMNLIDRAALSNTTVFISGETGTGKELVAHELHQRSDRWKKPFVVVNCAAIPRELIESELFGHEKGAFTGAHKQKSGKLEIAGEGTAFFDEVGNLPLEMQGKFLRVLQERTFERVGGTVSIPIHARFIFATNEDLKKAVADGKFREDLYYRINVFPIKLPPLRERREDIPVLIEHFLKKYNQSQKKNIQNVSQQVLDCFLSYPWYGNIRQLENEIEKSVTMAGFDTTTISVDLISDDIRGDSQDPFEGDENEKSGLLNDALAAIERRMIREALKKFNSNITKAAIYLGISRRGLHKKLNRLGPLN